MKLSNTGENEQLTLVFPCSGAADVGAISDRSARALSRSRQAKMYCLAGVGGRVDPIMETTKDADRILAIDGCESDCAKCTLELAGFDEVIHMRVTDLGLTKGESALRAEHIKRVVDRAIALLHVGVKRP